MRTFITFFVSVLLISFQAMAHSSTPVVPSTFPANDAAISNFKCEVSGNQVKLNWNVSANQTTDRLIVQKSRNGKKFEMIGLVFGTDKAGIDTYYFHEKMSNKKNAYRIIIIRKDQSVEYSDVVTLQSSKKTPKN